MPEPQLTICSIQKSMNCDGFALSHSVTIKACGISKKKKRFEHLGILDLYKERKTAFGMCRRADIRIKAPGIFIYRWR